ncbi:MAG: hypothetical protein K5669_02750 [Lachnospiraceae bacterium]|nr:hypothetical protein [Lachnospiraceae bacterium]
MNNIPGGSADDTEKRVEAWIANAVKSSELDLDSFPENADYIVEAGGNRIDSKTKDGKAEKLEEYFTYYKVYSQTEYENGETKNNDLQWKYLDGQEVYLAQKIGDKTIFIHYSLGVAGEWIVLGITVLAYILAILIPSIIFISTLKKLVFKLAEEKWRKEYETKQKMAQIAHDLKTPLTVIRGNADLLLENNPDEESKESIEAIIKNSERIAKSVLEILENDK